MIFLSRNKQRELWVVFVYSIISCTTDIVNRYGHISNTTYFYSISLFTILEYSLFALYLYFIYKSPIIKKILIIGTVVFYSVAAYNVFFDSQHVFDSLPASVESIFILCYSIFYFYDQLKKPETNFIYSTKAFWIVIAILLYLAATFILFLTTAYMTEKEKATFWPINSEANILKNLLLSIAFILRPQPKNQYLQNIYNL